MTADEALQIVESPMYKTADSRQEAVETLRRYVERVREVEDAAANERDQPVSGPHSAGMIYVSNSIANLLAAAREGRDE